MEIPSSLSPIPCGSTESCPAPALEQQEGGRTRRFSRLTKTSTDHQFSCASQQESDLCFDPIQLKTTKVWPKDSQQVNPSSDPEQQRTILLLLQHHPHSRCAVLAEQRSSCCILPQNPSICPRAEDAVMTLHQWMSCGELKYPAQGHWSSWRAGVWRLSSHQHTAVALKPLIPSCHSAGPRGTAEPCKAEHCQPQEKCLGPLETQSLQYCPAQARLHREIQIELHHSSGCAVRGWEFLMSLAGLFSEFWSHPMEFCTQLCSA